VCDEANGACVECVENGDCTNAAASACVESQCTPCTESGQCSHLAGATVCDTRTVTGATGECVQCTGPEDGACVVGADEYVCDSLNRRCAAAVPDNEVGSAGSCQPCLSDEHCSTGRVCVQTEYDDELVPGWFCMWERGAQGAPTSCPLNGRPYYATVTEVTSLDGREGLTVCGLSVSTCAALQDFRAKACDAVGNEAAQCGEPDLDDGLCRVADPDANFFQCTMRCLSGDDCQVGVSCDTGETPPYCTFD
jgi:hypothetical protein